EFFELELEHRNQFLTFDHRQTNGTEENPVRGQPRDVEPALEKGLGGSLCRKRLWERDGLLAGQLNLAATDAELPKLARILANFEDVAGMEMGLLHAFTHTSDFVSSISALRCSSVCVTRNTSSIVVWPALTLTHPS